MITGSLMINKLTSESRTLYMISINSINHSFVFLRFEFTADVHLSRRITLAGAGVPASNAAPIKIFLGWKNANEVLRQLEIENMNVDTNYLQTECAKEGFCYSVYKPREEKKSRKYAHSLYEDVQRGRPGVGIYTSKVMEVMPLVMYRQDI